MFDIGWRELLLIGIVALIVVGPEDLPKLFHTLGRITSKARMMAREFSSAMEDAAKSSGLDEAGQALKDVNKLTSKRALGLDALDRAADRFEKWDPVNPLQEARRAKPVPDPAAPVPPVAAADEPATPGAAPEAAPPVPPAAPGVSAPFPANMAADTADGRRRLHAVRRSDRD